MRASSIISLTAFMVALLAFLVPMVFERSLLGGYAMFASFGLSGIWLVAVICGLLKGLGRAAWLIAGFPLAGFWPVMGLFAQAACQFGKDCM